MNETKRLGIGPVDIAQAVLALGRGGVVAFPTDTVYGVGADARCPEAIAALYEIKERPLERAIPVLLARAAELGSVAQEVPECTWRLVERFWPGPLTVVVRRASWLPAVLTGGAPTVAVRVPDHPVVWALIDGVGAPLAATSANISGRPSPVTADDVLGQLEGRITLLLDGGPCAGGQASTVVDLTSVPVRVLRTGPITADQIRAVLSTT